MAKALVNGINMHYEVAGHGEPLLLISGYTADSSVWMGVLDKLAKHYQVILFDNRGVGRTEAPSEPFTIETMAKDALALLDHLGVGQAHILGHSMGTAIAKTIAYHNPDRVKKLILCNPFIKINAASALTFKTRLKLRKAGLDDRTMIELSVPWSFSNQFLSNPKNIEDLIAFKKTYSYPQSIEGQEAQLNALLQFDSSSWHKQITTPTLIMAGEEDILTPLKEAQILAGNIKNSQFVIMPGAHLQVLEIPREFTDRVLGFLKL